MTFKEADHIRSKIVINNKTFVIKKIKVYRYKWEDCLERMPEDNLPKQLIKYKPKGKKSLVRSKKR